METPNEGGSKKRGTTKSTKKVKIIMKGEQSIDGKGIAMEVEERTKRSEEREKEKEKEMEKERAKMKVYEREQQEERSRQDEKVEHIEKKKETKANDDDFYSLLDRFTQTDQAELTRIEHLVVDGNKRGYECKRCQHLSKFFTAAEKHFYDHDTYSKEKRLLRKVEEERQEARKNIAKLEKGVGKVKNKVLEKSLRSIQFIFINQDQTILVVAN